MDGVKPWWASVGVIGGLVAFLAPIVAAVTHRTISATDIQSIVDNLSAVATAVGALAAIYGRVRATKTIGSTTP